MCLHMVRMQSGKSTSFLERLKGKSMCMFTCIELAACCFISQRIGGKGEKVNYACSSFAIQKKKKYEFRNQPECIQVIQFVETRQSYLGGREGA